MPSSVTRVALVTGAGRGIGAATVRALAERGYGVVAVDGCSGEDHRWPGVDYPLAVPANLEQFDRYDDRVVAVRTDVRHRQGMEDAAQTALECWGRLRCGGGRSRGHLRRPAPVGDAHRPPRHPVGGSATPRCP
ncbi:MAG: SDR family NAD(P)-dependent oxidoreductase [Nocardioides sp.]